MWDLRRKVRTLVSTALARPRSGTGVLVGRAAYWLPPVLGPQDWSTGMMADPSAGWYLDRR